jgi:hypothetical protein
MATKKPKKATKRFKKAKPLEYVMPLVKANKKV